MNRRDQAKSAAVQGGEKDIFVVALTGGVASGKSAASSHFETLGASVIDTDLIARDIVGPGSAALREIASYFGQHVLDEQGHLRRDRLRQEVFTNDEARRFLESVTHPAILAEVKRRLLVMRDQEVPYCIVVIPLLAEIGTPDFVDHTLLVDADDAVRLQRLMARDGMSEMAARRMMATQASRADRLAVADDVIVNEGTLEDLHVAVEQLHRKYQRSLRSPETGL